jgi:hypothetical protein
MLKPWVFISVVLISVMFSISVLYAQDDLYEKGLKAYFKRDYAAAVKYLKEYVAQMPDAEAYYLLGYATYELERNAKPSKGRKDFWSDTDSVRYFREAYLIDPNVSVNYLKKVKK